VIIIMQENRSFDSFFGTFPGANGIPRDDAGIPTVCVPVLDAGSWDCAHCVRPYHDLHNYNAGGPHGQMDVPTDVNDGGMDGYLIAVSNSAIGSSGCDQQTNPAACAAAISDGVARSDAVGYHTENEIPSYWAYARGFTLQDAMFQPNASWSFASHLFLVSEWSAICTSVTPMSCVNEQSYALGS
jgi:phospholipase C